MICWPKTESLCLQTDIGQWSGCDLIYLFKEKMRIKYIIKHDKYYKASCSLFIINNEQLSHLITTHLLLI